MAKNRIEVKAVDSALYLFYNGENLEVGWQQASVAIWKREFLKMQAEFHLLNLYDEYALVTEDTLLGIKFLTQKERTHAAKLFVEHLKP